MKTKSEHIAKYTSDIMDFVPVCDGKYKEKGDIIRITIELAWAQGVAEGSREVIETLKKEMKL